MTDQPPRRTYCPLDRPNARLRLICFPHAGGGASAYRTWAGLVPETVEVHAVQLPGRESRLREACVTSMRALIEDVTAAIQPLEDRPFALFGHSFGALLAFETARRLATGASGQPVHLFASGRRAPHLSAPSPPIAELEEGAFVDEIRRRYDGVPREVLEEPELLALLLPALRGDIRLNESYRYIPANALECPITVYGGVADPEARHDELAQWRQHTSGAFALRLFPGSHFFIRSSSAAVGADVFAVLDRLVAGRREDRR